MKKFISVFLVISIMMCNLNSRVVEALSTCGNEVKSLVNTLTNNEEKKTVNKEESRSVEKETKQVQTDNDVKKSKVVSSTNKEEKETVQTSSNNNVGWIKAVDSKIDDEGNVQEDEILVYDISKNKFYYYIVSEDMGYEIDWFNENITKNKTNLNDLLKYNNLAKSDEDEQQVNFVITGNGRNINFEFDQDWYGLKFNIIFFELNGEECHFSLKNVKSIDVIGDNTISNSSSSNTALEYSFDGSDSKPLKMNDSDSFIVYNEDKENIENNIFYDDNFLDVSENSGGTSIVNVSFEENEVSSQKNFVLDNGDTQKNFSTKIGCKALSMLLVSDEKSYILKEKKEDNTLIPYYYRSFDSGNESNKISGPVKTKITLKKYKAQNCYYVSAKKRVEVVVSKNNDEYYLSNTLKDAMENYLNTEGVSYRVIFLGNYDMKPDDFIAIKNYNKNINKITFETTVDDLTYLLNINQDLELMVNSKYKFPVTFDKIKFNYDSNDKCIYSNGRSLTFGDNVEMNGANYPSVSLVGRNLSIYSDSVNNNSSLIISSGDYKSVIGVRYSILQNIDMIINGGRFYGDVIAVDGKVVNNAKLEINNGTFFSRVLGAAEGSNIAGSLEVSIKKGMFRDKVIGINGGTVKNAILTINNGSFNDDFIGALSNDTIKKVTLKGIFNRYLFSNNERITCSNLDITINNGTFNGDVIGNDGNDIELTMTISKGTFKKLLIGNNGLAKDKATIYINGNVTIPIISDFTDLVVGKNNKKVTLSGVESLDKVNSKGDLHLNNGSKISFKSDADTSELNNIISDGNKDNTLALASPVVNRNKDKVLINLSGEIQNNNNNKLKIVIPNGKDINEIYLFKFTEIVKADVQNKYNINGDYYIRDKEEEDKEKNKSGYVILYPQTTFDLKYNIEEDKLYMGNNGNYLNAWWYTKATNDNTDINLDVDKLYTYKGYNLFKDPQKNINRNIILTGTSSGKNIVVNSTLNHVNIILESINLTDSSIKLDKIKSLKINGKNNINNSNSNKDIFTYTFNNSESGNKISFSDENSYLKIATNDGDSNPFNGLEGERIDLKFYKPFSEEDDTVRLKNNATGKELNLNIPQNTQRVVLLVEGEGKYNLYYGKSGDTGTSVYVAGNTQEKFTDTFEKSTNVVYQYVRRANPVSTIGIELPRGVNFGVNVETNTLNSVNENNWKDYFYTTDMKFKNNSTVVQDQFTDEKGVTHQFGKANNAETDVNIEYMGVYSSENIRNGIQLISNEKLDSNIITESTCGIKLALKLGDIPIDESNVITEKSLGNWIIGSNKEETIPIVPNFSDNNKFFNVSKYLKDEFKLNSSHNFVFRYGLKK